jgi:hypothetical protein
MSDSQCIEVLRRYQSAKLDRVASERDLGSTSPNASPIAVRHARFQATKRDEGAAREVLEEHRHTCSLCKTTDRPQQP